MLQICVGSIAFYVAFRKDMPFRGNLALVFHRFRIAVIEVVFPRESCEMSSLASNLLSDSRISVETLSGSRAALIKCGVIGEYYVGTDRNVELGREKARHYCPPSTEHFSFDLNAGLENWIDWTDGHAERIDIFQKWFLRMATEGHNIAEKILYGVHVVIGRGVLRRITSTPSLKNLVNWRVVAQKQNGIIFMYAVDEESQCSRSVRYPGICLETHITCNKNKCSPHLMCSPDPDMPVKSSEQFRTVCRLEVLVNRRKFNILLTGEIDAVDKEDGEYVEIKAANETDDDLLSYSKRVNTWLQCKLACVKKVVVGYKDEQGFVKKIKEMKTDDLVSKMCMTGRIETQKNFQFLHRLINQIDGHLQEGKTCAISFEAGNSHAELTQLPNVESILFEEFRKMLNSM